MDSSIRARMIGGRVGLVALLGGAVLGAQGCGWTARDEFLYAQRTTVRAAMGDGSRAPLAADWDGPAPITTATVATAP